VFSARSWDSLVPSFSSSDRSVGLQANRESSVHPTSTRSAEFVPAAFGGDPPHSLPPQAQSGEGARWDPQVSPTGWHRREEAAGWQQPEAPPQMRVPMCQPGLPSWEGWGLPAAPSQDAEPISKDPLIPAPILLLLIHVDPPTALQKEALSV